MKKFYKTPPAAMSRTLAVSLAFAFAAVLSPSMKALDTSTENYVKDGVYYAVTDIPGTNTNPGVEYNDNIIGLVVGPDVTTIGNYAFSACRELAEIDMSNAKSLKTIGEGAFQHCYKLSNIAIPASVESIGASAFSACNGCESVVFADGSRLKSLGELAFSSNTSLVSVSLPASLESVGEKAFYNCRALESCRFEDGSQLTSLSVNMFAYCNKLREVTLPAGLREISNRAFEQCSALESIGLPDGLTSIGSYAFQSCTALKSVEIPESVTSMGTYAFYSCTGLESVVAALKTIPNYAFSMGSTSSKSALTSVTLSNTESIGKQAFYCCRSLPQIELPATLTSVGEKAFYYCDKLTKVISLAEDVPAMDAQSSSLSTRKIYVPDASVDAYAAASGWTDFGTVTPLSSCLVEVGGILYRLDMTNHTATVTYDNEKYSSPYDDRYPALENVEIPSSVSAWGTDYAVTSVGERAFCYCRSLKSVALPETITSIGKEAFRTCDALESINLPLSVREIGDAAFYGCSSLPSVDIPEGITSISAETFLGCDALAELVLPSSLQTIKNKAFYKCTALTELVFPPQLTEISSEAFYKCTGLTFIHFGENVTTIASKAFMGCTALAKIVIDASVPPAITPVSNTSSATFPTPVYSYSVWVPNDAYEAYKSDSDWSALNIKTPALNIDGICYQLDKKDYTATVIANDDGGYKGAVVIPECITVDDVEYSVDAVAESAFAYCKVTSIDLGNVTSLGDFALGGTDIASIDFSRVRELGNMVCAGCSFLTEATLPKLITRIPDGIFYKCFNLKSIAITEFVTEIGAQAFMGAGLEAVTLPPRTRTLGSECFAGCENLSVVHFPTGLRVVGEYAFSGDMDLKSIVWYDSEEYEDDPDKPVVNAPRRAVAVDPAEFKFHLTAISSGAFERTGLTYFYVPATVEKEGLTIAPYAFDSTAVAHIDVAASELPNLDPYGFDYDTYNTSLIFVPDGRLEAYKSDKSWGQFKGYPTVSDSQMYVFANEEETQVYYAGEATTSATGNFVVPDVVTDGKNNYDVVALSASALRDTDVTSVELPASVISVGNSAFEGCQSLKGVSYRPDGSGKIVHRVPKANIIRRSALSRVEEVAVAPSLGKNAFADCSSLTSVELPGDIQEIPVNAFRNCTALTSVEIPQSVCVIAEAAFMGSGLTSVVVPENVSNLGARSFKNCADLATVSLPDNFNFVGNQAFSGCTSLKSIVLPEKTSYIGSQAFAGIDMEKVESCNTEAPYVEADDAFSPYAYNNAQLLVPRGADASYQNARIWPLFKNHEIITSVDEIITDNNSTAAEYYNMQGVRVTSPAPGINIRRLGNRTEKIIVR